MYSLRIILPCFNEEDVIKEVIEGYLEVAENMEKCRILVTEDGSTDQTRNIIKNMQEKYDFDFIYSEKRKGYLQALKDSLLEASKDAELIFYSDTDNTFNTNDMSKLLHYIDGNDIVSGYRKRRKDPIIRKLVTKIYKWIINRFFRVRFKDSNSGFKLVKKSVVDQIVPKVVFLKYGFSTELLIRAHYNGYDIKEIDVFHKKRKTGVATQINIKTLVKVSFGMIKDLRLLKKDLRINRNR